MNPPRLIRYVWASPTTAAGLIFVPLALASGGKMQIIDDVLEIYGGFVSWSLRHATVLKGGASAMTLGHVVLGVDPILLDLTRAHERVHVRQCERWGPLFIPAYLFGALLAYLSGKQAYRDNPFEREAYEQGR